MTDERTTPRSEPELLPVVSTTVSEYSPIAAGLAELRAQVEAHLPSLDCSTPAGDKLARQSRFALVKLRTSLEERRKEIKAPALERCRVIDAEAKRITAEIEALEEPFDTAIKAQEAKEAAEKALAEQREQDRKRAVESEIEGLRRAPLGFITRTSADIAAEIDRLQSLSFGHLEDPVERDRAQTAQREAIGSLTHLHGTRVEHEAEQEKIAADRAENERIARDAAERRRQDEEAAAVRRAEEEAQAEARRKQQEAEDAARREQQQRQDAEREAAAAEQRAKDQAEGDRRRRNEATIQRVRNIPVELLHAPTSLLEQAIADLGDSSAGSAGMDDDYVDQYVSAATEGLDRLRQMLEAQQKRDQQEQEYRELRAKEQRERAEEAARLQAARDRVEAEAIANASLRDAAEDGLNLLLQFVDDDHLVVRKLAAALAREVQP